MESLRRKTHFASIPRSFLTNSDGDSSQSFEKFIQTWIFLATIAV